MNLFTRALIWGLLCCFPVAATASEQDTDRNEAVEIGMGLICNSEAQVERYLALNVDDDAPDKAIEAVNAEAKDPNACALAGIMFVRGGAGKSVAAPGGHMKITPVMIVAAQTATGWQRIAPLLQYTAIFEKLDEA